MRTIQYLTKDYYEIFEYHNLPRGLKGLTLKVNKKGASQHVNGHGSFTIPINSLAFVIAPNEELPAMANFLIFKSKGFNGYKHYTTKSFKIIHERIAEIKEYLNAPNLQIFVAGKEVPLYVKGSNYKDRGIYQGIYEDSKGKYHYFSDNKNNHKEYLDVTVQRNGK